MAIVSALLALGLAAPAKAQSPRVKLLVGFQDATLPATVAASKVLNGAPYDVEWVVLPGPAAQLSALYSKAIDVGHMGDTSLIIEQGKAKADWTHDTAPLQIIAGWRANDTQYPPIVTVVRTDAHVSSLADLRGKKWAFNFGGFNYLQYVLSQLKAGLKPDDFKPIQLVDQNATAAALNAGRVDVYSGSTLSVAESIDKGAARVLLTSDELDIPALGVFTARGDVLRDPAKHAALADFLARLNRHWAWYANNLDAVEQIFVNKIGQTPARAKLTALYLKANFQPLDARLAAREQHIANILFDADVIQKKIDVGVEFDSSFNTAILVQ